MKKIACAFFRIKAKRKIKTYPIYTHLRPIFVDYFGNIAVKCYQMQKNVTKIMEECYQTNENVTNHRN